jgi:hypothetical protein
MTPGDGTLGGSLNVALGPYLSFSYTAAQDQTLEKFSYHLFNNSGSGSCYGARDSVLFVQIDGGGYTQFSTLETSTTANVNQGIVSFSDSLAVSSGQLVEIRLGLTDRTRTQNNLQTVTRIGDIQIFATIPNPTWIGLISTVGGGLLFIPRRFMI